MLRIPALVDPLALILPTRLFLILADLRHPNTPLVESLAKAFEHATAQERAETLRNVEMLAVPLEAVKKAVNAGAARAQ